MEKNIRVLIAKAGLDGHDRGAIVISQALRDHGMEVIYTGLRQSPKQIAYAAVQEDVDVIGLSSLSGAHNTLFPKVIEELKNLNASDIPVIGGGVIPSEDIPFLMSQGIQKIFTSGSSTESLAQYIKQLVYPELYGSYQVPKRISHIGIAVRHIDDALTFYTDHLGLFVKHMETIESEGVRVAFLPIGESQIELLEPLDESSPIYKFIHSRGEGIHHIAFEVDDIKKRIKTFKQNGIKLIQEQPKIGGENQLVSFIHPREANGVLFELCQPMKGKEDE